MADTSDILLVAGAIGVLYLIHKNNQAMTATPLPTTNHTTTPAQVTPTSGVLIGGGGGGGGGIDTGVIYPQVYQGGGGFDIFDYLDQMAYQQQQTYREQYPIAPDVIAVEQ